MKRISKLGLLVLAPAFAGCATISSLTPSFGDDAQAMPPQEKPAAAPAPAKTASAPAAKPTKANPAAKPGTSAFNAAALAGDLEGAILAAQAQRKAGQLAEAARALSQLVLVAPDDARVVGEYGKTLTALGRSDDALAFLDRAIQLKSDDWTFYSAQGIALDQKSNYAAAQASYMVALQLQPGEPTVLNNNALSLMQAGDLAGAEKLLLQAKPGTPEYPRLAQNLALVQGLRAAQKPASPTVAVAETPLRATAPAPVVAAAVAAVPVVTEPVAAVPVMTAKVAPAPSVVSVDSVPKNVPEAGLVTAEASPTSAAERSSLPLFAPAARTNPAPVSESVASPIIVDMPVSTAELATPQIVAQADLGQPAASGDGALVIETIDTVPDENEPHLPTSELILVPLVDEPVPVNTPEPEATKQPVQVAQAPVTPAKSSPAATTKTAPAKPAVSPSATPKVPTVPSAATSTATVQATATPADAARLTVAKSATNVAATPRNYYLQAGAFASEARAGQTATTLIRLGARVIPATSGGKPIFRVRIGPFLNVQQANTARTEAQALGHADLQIVTQ